MDTEVERRVRAAFEALADTVDVTERPRRRKRWYVPVLAAAAAIIVIAVGVLAIPPTPPTAPPATHAPVPPPPSPPPLAVPYDLYTHCGIDEARLGETYYEAETPLGKGSPPPDWGNPYQPGTMTVVSPTAAVFHDTIGHEVRFRVRPEANSFKKTCD
jgi:hypothetical protein